jgi:uncharacterized membrane protein (DUF2068 family)
VLSYIISALSLARHAVALTLVAGAAATTMVAGAVDQNAIQPQHQTAPMTSVAPTTRPEPTAKSEVTHTVTANSATPETSSKPEAKTSDIEALVKDCLTKYAAAKTSTTAGTAASEACRRAIEASSLTSSDFWARFAPKTEPTTQPQKPAPNLEALVTDCLTKYAAAKTSTTAGTAASDACRRAIEASGLTSTEFWTRFALKAQPSTAPVKPSTDPATNIEALAKYCLTKYAAAKTSATAGTAASEACRRAIEASGLSATEFWAKFGTPQAPKSEPKPRTTPTAPPTQLSQLTKYCLALHAALSTTSSREQVERAYSVCNQAIAESKLTPTEFWTKAATYR